MTNDIPAPTPDGLSPEVWEDWRARQRTAFDLALDDAALARFRTLFAALLEWNAKMNLVSIRSGKQLLWRHFADSLAGAALIRKHCGEAQGLKVIDVGTGAGFPGLPVKIARPDLAVTLLESITKKCAFLEHAAGALGFPDIRILNGRAEEFGQQTEYRERFDVVLSRAVSKLSPNLEIALPFLKVGGIALVFKTGRYVRESEEMKLSAKALRLLGGTLEERFFYELPGEEMDYCLLVYKKTAPTPKQYPRRTGVPEKKPL